MSRSLSNVVFQIHQNLEKAKIAASITSKTLDGASVASSDDSTFSTSPKPQGLDNLWIGAAILDQMAANSSADHGGSAARTLPLLEVKGSKDVVTERRDKMAVR